jgi:cytochrome c oxidase subunit 4
VSGELRTFLLVWLALMALLALTMGVTFLPIGELKAPVNFSIAAVKAGLIAWFFMHLRETKGLVRLFAVGALFWLFLLFALTFADYLTRQIPPPPAAATAARFPRD